MKIQIINTLVVILSVVSFAACGPKKTSGDRASTRARKNATVQVNVNQVPAYGQCRALQVSNDNGSLGSFTACPSSSDSKSAVLSYNSPAGQSLCVVPYFGGGGDVTQADGELCFTSSGSGQIGIQAVTDFNILAVVKNSDVGALYDATDDGNFQPGIPLAISYIK